MLPQSPKRISIHRYESIRGTTQRPSWSFYMVSLGEPGDAFWKPKLDQFLWYLQVSIGCIQCVLSLGIGFSSGTGFRFDDHNTSSYTWVLSYGPRHPIPLWTSQLTHVNEER